MPPTWRASRRVLWPAGYLKHAGRDRFGIICYACKHDEILELNQPIRIQFEFEMAEISRAAIRRLLFEMKAIVISPVNAGVLSVQRFENMSLQECCLRAVANRWQVKVNSAARKYWLCTRLQVMFFLHAPLCPLAACFTGRLQYQNDTFSRHHSK